MAWNFAEQIHSLTGFDAASTSDSETGEDFNLLANQWLVDAAKEIINMMPQELKQKCSVVSVLNATNGTTLDLDGKGKILQVTRKYASDKHQVPCREVSPSLADLANDSSSMHAASSTDPIFYKVSNSSSASTLFVLPTPTDNEPSNVYHVGYPPNSTAWDGSNLPGAATSIANFPDELEHLVPLRAAINALEYQAVQEEDPELYLPLIQNLKQDYQQGLQMLGVAQPQQGAR
tara:strand:- start:104 stop:802 length:699 start_codon:yes stop_codon:yes gene_type:complete